jgi:hypothetical protein
MFDEELAYDSSAPHGIAYLIAHLSYLKGLEKGKLCVNVSDLNGCWA